MIQPSDIPLPFLTDTFAKGWADWLQYRKERKFKPYTPTGLKKTYAALADMSGGNEELAIKMLDQSMSNNWQGFFPLKNDLVNAILNNKPGPRPGSGGTSADRIKKASEW